MKSVAQPGKRSQQHRTNNAREGGTGRVRTVNLANVRAQRVKWLWYPYIPLGKVTLIDGDPGLGKSWVGLAIASACSNGDALPGGSVPTRARTLILSAEDGLGDTIRPRLDALGADLTMIDALDDALTFDERGLARLDRTVADLKPTLIVVDPLFAYTGKDLDMHRANEIRPVMRALAGLAETHHCAIVLIRHLTKGGRDKAIYRGLGSIDVTAACRSVLLVGADPDDHETRVLTQIKSNLAAFGPTLTYRITDGRFEWTGTSTLTAAQMLAEDDPNHDDEPINEAIDFLQSTLATGGVPFNELKRLAAGVGSFSIKTLRRAKKRLTVESRPIRSDGELVGWKWQLPRIH